jgi:hypothetical protein
MPTLRLDAMLIVKFVHRVALTEATRWYDDINEVREVFLDSLRALSARSFDCCRSLTAPVIPKDFKLGCQSRE